MTFISYAQNFEDVLLWRALKKVSQGFYIDVGASHPDTDSVTRAFYDRGWSGINIEPASADFERLQAARTRDVNVNVAIGETSGTGTLFVVPGTGLSTMETDALLAINDNGFEYHDTPIKMQTLADICQEHVTGDIHFLKIDVEGAERAVLSGCDFDLYRPWILVVEATAPMSTTQTHMEWEHIVLSADYHFAWFDGLNRFYIADEHWRELASHFLIPINVFDNFIRVADTDWAKRINTAEARVAELLERCALSERKYSNAMESLARFVAEKYQALHELARIGDERNQVTRNATMLRAELVLQQRVVSDAQVQMQREIAAIYKSTSWQVTLPIRWLKNVLLGGTEKQQDEKEELLSPSPDSQDIYAAETLLQNELVPHTSPSKPVYHEQRRGLKHVVHQFHAGSAVADAITNAMLLMRRLLRSMGYASEIFVIHRDPLLADEFRLLDEIPKNEHYVLIVRHSMGFDRFEEIEALPAVKILIYHNITPSEFLLEDPSFQAYSQLGRDQLKKLKPVVSATLADSDYNAIELYGLGFSPVQTCMLLFDVDELRRRAMPRLSTGVFTILFVGRLVESKGQRDLLHAYLRFRATFDAPSHLVLAGKYDERSPYFQELNALAYSEELRSHVTLTGMVTDQELDGYYASADLYVSVSQHEGFGVPLVEAMANGVPILAWPCGAVPYTLGNSSSLLTSREPEHIASQMLCLARNPALRARIARQQYRSLGRFDLKNQRPALTKALAIAGARVPADVETVALLSANIRFIVTGHLIKNYSLAIVNRTLALAIERFRPGRIRVVAVEEEKGVLDSQTPPGSRTEILRLAERAKGDCGPVIVISQHYPVHIPEDRGDLLLSLFFWEESVIPEETVALLSQNFSGVIAPSRFVAKALADSGLSIPILQLDYFAEHSAFKQTNLLREQDDVFTFLHVSSCFPRKGVDILLQAFARSFRSRDKVRLIVKGFPNPHNRVLQEVAALRLQHLDMAEIIVINEDMEEAQFGALYAQADTVVLPTRGEGFNLPAAEALAIGIPLIVTGYGGHMDFCGGQRVRFIDYSFVKSESHFKAPHSVWVEPEVDDLVAAMTEAVGRGKRPSCERLLLSDSTRLCSEQKFELEIKKLEAFAVQTLVTPLNQVSIAWVSTWNVRCGIAGYSRYLIENMLPSDRINLITILADERTEPQNGKNPVLPCWQLQMPDGMASLLKAVTITDADIVVIQHQPGLMRWSMLGHLLKILDQRNKIVAVTLHNTVHLLETEIVERSLVLDALALISRLIVHTISDLNRLKALGLVDNVTMIPQGVPAFHRSLPVRLLSPLHVPLIGSYGFFLPGKGISNLILSLGILHLQWPTAKLRLVNANYGDSHSQMEIERCKEIAAEAGLDSFIEWNTDYLPDEESIALLAECDLIALPYQSSKEASSAALRTALCAGLPVMVTPIALFDEADDAVIRFSGVTSAEIAAGLTEMLGDQIGREQSRKRAEVWMSNHSWASLAKRTQGLLLSLSAERHVTMRGH